MMHWVGGGKQFLRKGGGTVSEMATGGFAISPAEWYYPTDDSELVDIHLRVVLIQQF